ncbi:MAG: hypothetical protein HOV81_27350 [Kofleriaceae bacterium]|nr:hypothetical protein [Kofleriaceae bacterium]
MKDSSRRFVRGMEYGAIATLAMSLVMFLDYVIGASPLKVPLPLAIVTGVLMRSVGMRVVEPGVVIAAIPIFFAYGALWMGFAVWSTDRMRWWKGLVVGLGLWLLMMIFYLPIAVTSSFEIVTKPSTWIGTLIGHAVYGIVGGVLADDKLRHHRAEPYPAL